MKPKQRLLTKNKHLCKALTIIITHYFVAIPILFLEIATLCAFQKLFREHVTAQHCVSVSRVQTFITIFIDKSYTLLPSSTLN
jgi:hypothetical protein